VRARLPIVVATCALALTASAALASPAEFTLQGDNNIGGFATRTAGSTAAEAKTVFGAPTSQRRIASNQCRLVWRGRGLSMVFLEFDPAKNPCRTGFFVQGTMIGRAWHTVKGLRIGDSVARLRALYPRAPRVTGTGATDGWWLVTRRACAEVGGQRFPGLLARPNARNRVAAFVVQRGVCD
jgi:hypothetical protein